MEDYVLPFHLVL